MTILHHVTWNWAFTSFYITFTLFTWVHIILQHFTSCYISLHSFYIIYIIYIILHQFTSFYISLHMFTLFYIMLHYLAMLTMQDQKFFHVSIVSFGPSRSLSRWSRACVGARVEVGLSSAAHQTRTARHIVPQDTTRNVQKGSTYIKMQVWLWSHMGRNQKTCHFMLLEWLQVWAGLAANSIRHRCSWRWASRYLRDVLRSTLWDEAGEVAKWAPTTWRVRSTIGSTAYQHMSSQQNYCNTNLVLLRLGLSELAQNLHNR